MTHEELLKIANTEKVTIEQIKEYQSKKNIRFTEDYKAFLVEFNGILGFPGWFCSRKGKGMAVNNLYSLTDRYDIWEGKEKDRYGFEHYMIGQISTGDQIIQINEKGEHLGKIMFWNHEIAFYSDPLETILELDQKLDKNQHLSKLMDSLSSTLRHSAWDYVAPNLKTFLSEIIEEI